MSTDLHARVDPWKPGSWEPARLSNLDSVSVTLWLCLAALLRGFDYLAPSPNQSSLTTAVVEQAFPVVWWGLLFVCSGVVLVVGVFLRVHRLVYLSHWVLGVLTSALAVGFTFEYVQRPWMDGIGYSGALAALAAVYLVVAVRTGWEPRDE